VLAGVGRVDELEDASRVFLAGKDAFLDWEYGLEITRLVQARSLSAERQKTIALADPGHPEGARLLYTPYCAGQRRRSAYVSNVILDNVELRRALHSENKC